MPRRANLREHGLAFEVAKPVLDNPIGFDEIDNREDYGEDRFNVTGMTERRLVTVTYPERVGHKRVISARNATRDDQDDYFRQAT